jgi:hypothetical protein
MYNGVQKIAFCIIAHPDFFDDVWPLEENS